MNTKRHSMLFAAAFAGLFYTDVIGLRWWADSTAERLVLASLALTSLAFAAVGAMRRITL